MSHNTNTAARVLNALRARKAPLTIKQLAAFTRRHPLSVQRVVKPLRQAGAVQVQGQRMTGQRGRPALRYSVPAV